MQALATFQSLKNRRFAQLYAAQTISLFGDALTWVGLALLAFELVGENAAAVLATALTLRVVAFVALAPLAGALADRIDRKTLLVGADLARVGVIGLVPFVSETWQVYVLIFLLNAFTAFFTPTYKATIPLVTGADDYPKAIALSGATNAVLGVLGPGVAGGIAALLGWQSIFWVDAVTFLLSGLLILLLPVRLSVVAKRRDQGVTNAWQDVKEGTTRLWKDASIRFALVLQLVTSIAGAWVLVNTVTHVKSNLALGDTSYGWVMAAFGIGATLAALAFGAFGKQLPRTTFVLLGTLTTSLAVLPANFLGLGPLMALWLLAGAGQTLVNVPTQTLIADRTPEHAQGRVYGAHFAWSHLWWAGAYPLAGWLGSANPENSFVYGGIIALVLLTATTLWLSPKKSVAVIPTGER
ncbi:MAG: MFS transporter [Trueperaceae bacterium]|nr:MAG: MFS transporter [Trueperaceae bacterium]